MISTDTKMHFNKINNKSQMNTYDIIILSGFEEALNRKTRNTKIKPKFPSTFKIHQRYLQDMNFI